MIDVVDDFFIGAPDQEFRPDSIPVNLGGGLDMDLCEESLEEVPFANVGLVGF